MVLLPEGRAINHPEMIKMIKVLANAIQGKNFFVVSIKLDDDTELMIKTCDTEEEAIEVSELCTDTINQAISKQGMTILVRLVVGYSVHPNMVKHMYIENKMVLNQRKWIVQIKLNDNTIHPIAFLDSKESAMTCVEECVRKINSGK